MTCNLSHPMEFHHPVAKTHTTHRHPMGFRHLVYILRPIYTQCIMNIYAISIHVTTCNAINIYFHMVVCVCVCVRVRGYIYVHICMYTCILHMCVKYTCIHTYICTHKYVCVCGYTYTDIDIHALMCICVLCVSLPPSPLTPVPLLHPLPLPPLPPAPTHIQPGLNRSLGRDSRSRREQG